MPRRKFLKLGGAGVVVVVVAGVGAYLALQPQPQPVAPAVTPKPASTPVTTPSPSPKPTPTLLDKAKAEGSVMLYSAFDETTVKTIAEGFQKKYAGIKVDYVRASDAPMMERVETEYRAGKHTVDIFLTATVALVRGLEIGVADSYISSEAAVYPAEFKDPQGLWVATQYSPQCVAYNTDRVKGADVPQSYWDLLKPRFKDRIGVYQPTLTQTAPLISKKKIIGEARWKEFLQGLYAQNTKDIRGAGPIVTMLKTGEVEATLWGYTGTLTVAIQEGAPVDYVRKPNTLLSPPNFVWLYKNAPHPNAARLLYDYVLSTDGQNLVNDMGKYVMLRPGIPAKMGLGIGIGEPVKPDYVATLWPINKKDLDDIVTEWKSVFPLT